MKNNCKLLPALTICILLIGLFFTLCSTHTNATKDINNETNNISSANNSVENNVSTLGEIQTTNRFYNYYLAYKSTDYKNAIQNNPIDKKYIRDSSKCFTSQEQIELENKYIEVWKTELDHAIDFLVSKCDDQLKEKIQTAQNIWEESLLQQMDMEKDILNQSIGVGTNIKCLSKYKDAYRYRTFEIMYLSYSIEFLNDPVLNDYPSLTFKFED